MIDIDLLFAVWAFRDSDMNNADFAQEIERSFEATKLTKHLYKGMLNGNLSLGEIEALGDCLAQQNINPYDYKNCLEDNLEYVISHQVSLIIY